MRDVVRIGSIIIFHLRKQWKAKFFILCDVIFVVGLQGKCEIIRKRFQRSFEERKRGDARKRWMTLIDAAAQTSGAQLDPVYRAAFQVLLKDAEEHGKGKVISASVCMLENNDDTDFLHRGDTLLRYVACTPDDIPYVLGKVLYRDMKTVSWVAVDSGKPIHVPKVATHSGVVLWNPLRKDAVCWMPWCCRMFCRLYWMIGHLSSLVGWKGLNCQSKYDPVLTTAVPSPAVLGFISVYVLNYPVCSRPHHPSPAVLGFISVYVLNYSVCSRPHHPSPAVLGFISVYVLNFPSSPPLPRSSRIYICVCIKLPFLTTPPPQFSDGSFITLPLKDHERRVIGLLGVDTMADPHKAVFITHEISFFQVRRVTRGYLDGGACEEDTAGLRISARGHLVRSPRFWVRGSMHEMTNSRQFWWLVFTSLNVKT